MRLYKNNKMKQIKITLITIIIFIGTIARADEGMWLPFLLGRNYEDMKKHGLNLSEEEIYSINNSSLKDAIVSFGGYCTGEIISKNGLLLTNHHCGYDAIAEASNAENNYLDNGFWAKTHASEIPVPGLYASFIVRIEDVSETINSALTSEMTEKERNAKIKEISAILEKEAVEGTHYEAFVRDFYEGNEFYLFVKETFNDVRLVGTPPQSAGKYGGDTDNWMWPRHTADFSMFRVYSDAENKPSPYSESNKPYTPKHSLPISLKGVAENDFAMVLGFPGSTDRYLSSWGVEQAITLEQPKRVEIRAKKLDVMKSYMDEDVNVRLNYSSKYAQVANYWKYFIGQTAQVKNNNVIGKKRELEKRFKAYLKKDDNPFDVLGSMEQYYEQTNNTVNIKTYQSEFIYTVDANLAAFRFKFWRDAVASGNDERAGMVLTRLEEIVMNYFDKANMDIEIRIIHDVLDMYRIDIPMDQMGPYTKSIAAKGHKGIDKFIKQLRKKSMFVDQARFEAFMEKPSVAVLLKDPLFKLLMDMDAAYSNARNTEEIANSKEMLDKANRLFVAGLRVMDSEKLYYPNANSTLRLTYGNVLPYEPRDGVTYHFTTSIDGIMQKEDNSNPEFMVDPRIKELWLKKEYGQYADVNGNLTVNFLSNNDITGGNSGSPVINGDGQLIGAAFDGNWEAMSGDIYFEPNIQRTISVDIRYILWLTDKCYGATNLIEEMELVK